jgi:fatty acid desaturase
MESPSGADGGETVTGTPLAVADAGSAILAPIIVGIMIGGVVCALVVRRTMRPGAVSSEGEPFGDDERRSAMQTVAFIYALWALPCFLAAIFVGGTAVLLLSAINLAAAVVILFRLGPPKDHPAWRAVASISRR